MTNALTRHREGDPTDRWIGEIREVSETDFTSILWDSYGLEGTEMGGVQVPFENIDEAERPKILRGALFFCDVAAHEDGSFDLLGIELGETSLRDLSSQPLIDLATVMQQSDKREGNRKNGA